MMRRQSVELADAGGGPLLSAMVEIADGVTGPPPAGLGYVLGRSIARWLLGCAIDFNREAPEA